MSEHLSPYRFELIATAEGFAALRHRWEALLAHTKSSGLFCRWDWLFTWWQSFGRFEDRLAIIWAEREGEPFGLAPLFVRRSRYYGLPRDLLRFIGEGHADRADIVVRDPDPAFYDGLLNLLRNRVGWDLLYLRELPGESPFVAWACGSGLPAHVENDSACPYIALTPGLPADVYRRSLSRKLRAEFRNRTNRLQKLAASTISHRHLSSDDPVLERLRDIERQSAKAARDIPLVFSPEANFAFQRRLLGQMSPTVQRVVSTLELDGDIVAYLYGFIDDGVYYAYNMAFLPEYARFSPGKLVMQDTIEYCVREGVREFDLLRGSSYVKSQWTDRQRSQCRVTLLRDTVVNRLHGSLIFDLRPRIKPLMNWLQHRLGSSPPGPGAYRRGRLYRAPG